MILNAAGERRHFNMDSVTPATKTAPGEELVQKATALLDSDPATAGELFAQACEKGHGKACLAMGEMLKAGLGCPPGNEQARLEMSAQAFESACGHGVAEGCH